MFGMKRRAWRDLALSILSLLLCGPGAQAAPWNQDEDLAALGSLDSLLAYEDLQRAVQLAEDNDDAWGRPPGAAGAAGAAAGSRARPAKVAPAPWQPAEPDPQLYLLTEYDRGGQTRVKRNRETSAAAAAAAAGPGAAGRVAARGLRRHARNPPGGSGQRLSIVNPLDVLRQRLLLEIARRRKASVPQSNREMLEGIGKRSWPQVQSMIDRQIERCLSQLGDTMKPQDKLTRLAILYKAIEYGNCDPISDLADLPDQRLQQQQQQQQQQPHAPPRAQTQDQVESNQVQEDEWSARQQANGWSRNVRAATSSNLSS